MHPLLNFYINIPVPGVIYLNIVVLHHALGEVAEFEAILLASSHHSVQIKIFYINCHEFCIECLDDAVEENLYCGQIHYVFTAVLRIVYPIYSYCESGLVGISIFLYVIHHKSPIHNVPKPIGKGIC